MATVNHVNLRPEGYGGSDVMLIRWTPLTTANSDGDWIAIPQHRDITVQVFGTFGAGGTITMQGTNEVVASPTAPFTMLDSATAVLTFTAAAGKQAVTSPHRIRPLLSGGDGTTSLTVIVACRRAL